LLYIFIDTPQSIWQPFQGSSIGQDDLYVVQHIRHLDRASLAEQRRVTVPFLRRMLAAG